MHAMIPSTYQVFVRQDGDYGVALSLRGVIIRTVTGFGNEAAARTWIEQDSKLVRVNTPPDRGRPVDSRAP